MPSTDLLSFATAEYNMIVQAGNITSVIGLAMQGSASKTGSFVAGADIEAPPPCDPGGTPVSHHAKELYSGTSAMVPCK